VFVGLVIAEMQFVIGEIGKKKVEIKKERKKERKERGDHQRMKKSEVEQVTRVHTLSPQALQNGVETMRMPERLQC